MPPPTTPYPGGLAPLNNPIQTRPPPPPASPHTQTLLTNATIVKHPVGLALLLQCCQRLARHAFQALVPGELSEPALPIPVPAFATIAAATCRRTTASAALGLRLPVATGTTTVPAAAAAAALLLVTLQRVHIPVAAQAVVPRGAPAPTHPLGSAFTAANLHHAGGAGLPARGGLCRGNRIRRATDTDTETTTNTTTAANAAAATTATVAATTCRGSG